MEPKNISTYRLKSTRRLFLQGYSPLEIAERLGITYRYVLRLLRKKGEGWTVPDSLRQACIDAQAGVVQLYAKLGIRPKEIARGLGRSPVWVHFRLNRTRRFTSTPFGSLELLKPSYAIDGQFLNEGRYFVYELNDNEVFLKQGNRVFRVLIDNLFLKVKIPDNGQ